MAIFITNVLLTLYVSTVNFFSSCVGIMGGHGLKLATGRGAFLRLLISTKCLTALTLTKVSGACVPFFNSISVAGKLKLIF